MDRVDAHLGLVHLVQRVLKGLDRALNVGLDDEVELLHLGVGHGVEQVLERDVLDLVLLLDAGLEGALVSEAARLALVLEHAELVAGHRDALQAEHLDRRRRRGLLHVVAARVDHGANLAVGHARDDRVTHAQRAAVDQQRRDGAATAVELRLENVAGRERVRVRLQLEHVGLEQDGL